MKAPAKGRLEQRKRPTLTALPLPAPGVGRAAPGFTPVASWICLVTQDLAPKMLEMLG